MVLVVVEDVVARPVVVQAVIVLDLEAIALVATLEEHLEVTLEPRSEATQEDHSALQRLGNSHDQRQQHLLGRNRRPSPKHLPSLK